MKLNYELELMEMEDKVIAVPVGDKAKDFHGMITMNKVAKEMLEFIMKEDNPDTAFEKFLAKHPEEKAEDLAKNYCEFLNQLASKGLITP